MAKPHISIVTIAKTEEEIEEWKENLNTQSYSNYEVCYSTKDGIPQAWNDALSQADGEIILFSETDTNPIHDNWLEQIADDFNQSSKEVVHYGEFRGYGSFNFSNLATPADIIKQYELREDFTVGEDTELFIRMENDGINFVQNPISPVYHEPRPIDRKLSRSYDYGILKAKCAIKYGKIGPGTNTKNTTNPEKASDWYKFFSDRVEDVIKQQLSSIIFTAGFVVGLVKYLTRSHNEEL